MPAALATVRTEPLDELTLRRAQRGDDRAWRALIERYQAPVHALIWRLLAGRSRHRVEDLVQETFVRVLRALPNWDLAGPASLQTWILTIATRLTLNELRSRARIEWHGVELGHADWADHSHSLAFCLTTLSGRFKMHGMLNAYWEPLRFQLPPGIPAHGGPWRRWIDTSLPSPDDIVDWERAPEIADGSYLVQPRSVALLVVPPIAGTA